MTRRTAALLLVATLSAGCAKAKHIRPFAELPNALPGAYTRMPPMLPPAPAKEDRNAIPMQIAGIVRRGKSLHIRWDAPGATVTTIYFTSDGTGFRSLATTRELSITVVPPAPHGVLRVAVSNGRRHGYADARI